MKVFGIVGRKNCGKTHLVTRLVRLASQRGLRVSTDQARASLVRRRPARQGQPPAPRGRRARGAGRIGRALGTDARASRRGGTVPGGTAGEARAVRPRAGRGFQARAQPAARGVSHQSCGQTPLAFEDASILARRRPTTPQPSPHRRPCRTCRSTTTACGPATSSSADGPSLSALSAALPAGDRASRS